jgi:ketopantoate reductase
VRLASAFALRAEQDPAALGVQDLVVIAVKATALPEVALCLAPLIGPQTLVAPLATPSWTTRWYVSSA